MTKSMHSDNIDLLSRDDSVNLGMGHLSVRHLDNSEIQVGANGINSSQIGGTPYKGSGIKRQSINNGKKNNKKQTKGAKNGDEGACNSCEQVCMIF